MDLRLRFVDELRHRGSARMLDLAPAELAGAASDVVGAAGGGLALVQPLVRLPLGASSDEAATAEQVQATFGDGPCLEAVARAEPVSAVERELTATWPVYHHVLAARTTVRAVASFPLTQAGGTVFASLDLYAHEPSWRPEAGLDVVQHDVADLVGMMLLGSILGRKGSAAWPSDDRARRRQEVWVSVGMICEAAAVADADAMAMLRAYAFSQDLLLDEVAGDMLSGRLLPEAILETR